MFVVNIYAIFFPLKTLKYLSVCFLIRVIDLFFFI